MAEPTTLKLIYDGGLASEGSLHFYEFSRASYAFARLVSTVEIFRRSGHVPQKIGSKNYVDLVIKAPEKGSFPLDIIVPIAAEAANIAAQLKGIPLDVLLKYVIHIIKGILPKSDKLALELAKVSLDMEKERTKQTKEETKRHKILKDVVESGNMTTNLALELLKESLDKKSELFNRQKNTVSELTDAKNEFEESARREADFSEVRQKLEQIDNSKLVQLTTKVRPQVEEIGLPLRRSATIMSLQVGRERPIATFDSEAIQNINDRVIDEIEAVHELRMFAYDRDAGYGKCDVTDIGVYRITFSVPVDMRGRLRKKILEAIDKDATTATVRFVRNRDKTITSAILIDVRDR
ncbi:hypothetical protein E8L99_02615 [Phreatobacter aquaticus]|uniref:Uncharacterized protein n=1 Tax=Phreatobacter aquaticus TaxID=2570229 RepID=A0A4D7Q9D7_9HYPH|nr:hypothetical protein [Phreatobacter aquaticus]QCK84750.1 hypothetical protein E8L99_02615 [Phreatobacter aquaticus]